MSQLNFWNHSLIIPYNEMQNITGKEAVQYCLQKLTESGIVLYHCLPVCVICPTVFFAQWKLSTTLQSWMIIPLYFNLDTLQVMYSYLLSSLSANLKRKTPEQEILLSESTQGKEQNLLVLESCSVNLNKIWIINLLFLLLLFINPRIRTDGLLVFFPFLQKKQIRGMNP